MSQAAVDHEIFAALLFGDSKAELAVRTRGEGSRTGAIADLVTIWAYKLFHAEVPCFRRLPCLVLAIAPRNTVG